MDMAHTRGNAGEAGEDSEQRNVAMGEQSKHHYTRIACTTHDTRRLEKNTVPLDVSPYDCLSTAVASAHGKELALASSRELNTPQSVPLVFP